MQPPHDGRKGHYLVPGVGSTRPTVLFSVAVDAGCETVSHDGTFLCRSWRQAWLHMSRRRRDHWTKITSFHCGTPAALFGCLERLALPGYRNFVVAPGAADTLTLADFWDRAEKGGVTWEPTPAEKRRNMKVDPDPDITRFRRLVFSSDPDIIDYLVRGKRYLWVSGSQYLPCDENAIAASMGWKWIDTGDSDGYGQIVPRTARERSMLWLLVMQRLSEWWGRVSRAPWGLTCGQMAVGILRTHIPPKSLCTHTHAEAHDLEGEAAFGARASTWYLGDVGVPSAYTGPTAPAPPPSRYGAISGPLHSLDVRSMYPWLLREREFPQRLKQYPRKIRASTPQELAKSWGVLACVTITTRVPEYPLRVDDRIIYPVGTFTTVLTGPELLQLRKDGYVRKCHRMAVYQLGTPTHGAAAAMIEERELARGRQDHMWELFAKLLGNSLGGKLNQRKGMWVAARRKTAQVRWGQWLEMDAKNKRPVKYRALAGLVWRWQQDRPGSGPFAAAFAYLTAYGRLHMRHLREACPAETIVSQDTDGVWCLRPAVDALKTAGWEFGDKAGMLKEDKPVPAARFLGPRHYWIPGQWTLSGFADPVMHADGKTVDYVERKNPLRSAGSGAPCTLLSVTRQGTLDLMTEGGSVDGFGWVHPPYRGGVRITSGNGG